MSTFCRPLFRTLLGLAVVAVGARALPAQELFLVEDLDLSPPAAATVTGAGNQFVAFQGAIYFAGCDAAAGCELWKTDGTAPGTPARAREVFLVEGIDSSRTLGRSARAARLPPKINAGRPQGGTNGFEARFER